MLISKEKGLAMELWWLNAGCLPLTSLSCSSFWVVDQDLNKMSKQQMTAYMHDAVDQALQRRKADLSARRPELYPETIRFLTLSQIDNLWAQQLEVSTRGRRVGRVSFRGRIRSHIVSKIQPESW